MPYRPKPVKNDYAKEIATKTGTRPDAVNLWLKMNEVDPLTILQGIGSGKIKRQDFTNALLSDDGTLEFLRKYNSDGNWSSVWTGKEVKESAIKKVQRMIKEEIAGKRVMGMTSWNDFNKIINFFVKDINAQKSLESDKKLMLQIRRLYERLKKETENI